MEVKQLMHQKDTLHEFYKEKELANPGKTSSTHD